MGAGSYLDAGYDAARGLYGSAAQTLGDTLTAGQRGIEYARGTIAAYFPSWSEITQGVATVRSVAELGVALNLSQGPFLAGLAWGVGTKLIPDDMTATQRRVMNTLSSTMAMRFLVYEEFYYGLRDGLIQELKEIPELVELVRSGEIITMLTTALQELTASMERAFNFGSVIGESLFADIVDALDHEDYARTATIIGRFLGPMLLELLIALVTAGSSLVAQGGRIMAQKIIVQSSKLATKLLSSGQKNLRRITARPPPKALVDKRMGELALADTSGGDLSLAGSGGGELAKVAVAETPKPHKVPHKLADLAETPFQPKPASAATAKPAPAPMAMKADPDKALPKPYKEPDDVDKALKELNEAELEKIGNFSLVHVPQTANTPVSLPKAIADKPIGLLPGPTDTSPPIPPVDKGLADPPIAPLSRGLEPRPLPSQRPDLHEKFAALDKAIVRLPDNFSDLTAQDVPFFPDTVWLPTIDPAKLSRREIWSWVQKTRRGLRYNSTAASKFYRQLLELLGVHRRQDLRRERGYVDALRKIDEIHKYFEGKGWSRRVKDNEGKWRYQYAVDSSGKFYEREEIDFGHIVDVVVYDQAVFLVENEIYTMMQLGVMPFDEGRLAKIQYALRQIFMSNPRNYAPELKGPNRSNGALVGISYRSQITFRQAVDQMMRNKTFGTGLKDVPDAWNVMEDTLDRLIEQIPESELLQKWRQELADFVPPEGGGAFWPVGKP